MSAGLGTFANLMANNSSTPTKVEDEALSILAIVMASHWSGALNSGNGATSQFSEADFIFKFLPWVMERLRAPGVYYMQAQKKTCGKMNPFLMEFFARALLRSLGIRTATARICDVAEARKLGPQSIVKVLNLKPILGLRWVPSMAAPGIVRTQHCLVSEILPGAATLSYISRHFVGDDGRPFSSFESFGTAFHKIFVRAANEHIKSEIEIARGLGKECPTADKLYADFKPTPSELSAIRNAAAWNGEQYLRICAASVFLGCGA